MSGGMSGARTALRATGPDAPAHRIPKPRAATPIAARHLGLTREGDFALIGAVVAEFVAGTGGRASGLAYRILEAGYQLQIALVSATGIATFLLLSLLSHLLLLRWHERAVDRR